MKQKIKFQSEHLSLKNKQLLNKQWNHLSHDQILRTKKQQTANIKKKKSELFIQNLNQQKPNQEKQESENLIESIIPISHTKRNKQRSLSPIKNQQTIGHQKYFQIQSPKVNLIKNPKQNEADYTSIPRQKFSFPSQFFLNYNSQNASKPQTVQSSRANYLSSNYMVNQKLFLSKKKNKYRKTQIFSSDKKQKQKSFTINNHTIAEQILNLNKKQRQIYSNQGIQNQRYLKPEQNKLKPYPQSTKSIKTCGSKPAIQINTPKKSIQLQASRKIQLQKLNQYQSTPKLLQQQYLQSIYPQSKKFISQLLQILTKDYQILINWQSQLQLALRQNLYKIQQIVIEELYRKCRNSVKVWIQNQLQKIESWQKQNFSSIYFMKQEIQSRKNQLIKVGESLEEIKNTRSKSNIFDRINKDVQKNKPSNNLNIKVESSQKFLQPHQMAFRKNQNLIERKIFQRQYSFQVTETSKKVKQIIQNTQEKASIYCKHKLNEVTKFLQQQNQNSNEDSLDSGFQKIVYKRLDRIFGGLNKKTQPTNIRPDFQVASTPIIPKNQQVHQQKTKLNKIKQFISKELKRQKLNLPPQAINSFSNNTFSTSKQRQSRSYSKDNSSLSQKKSSSIIKDNQKVYKQFKTEFQSRRKNFISKNLPDLLLVNKDNVLKHVQKDQNPKFYSHQLDSESQSQDKVKVKVQAQQVDFQRPISQKFYQDRNNNTEDQRFNQILINTKHQEIEKPQRQYKLNINPNRKTYEGPGGLSRFNQKSVKNNDKNLYNRYSIH